MAHSRWTCPTCKGLSASGIGGCFTCHNTGMDPNRSTTSHRATSRQQSHNRHNRLSDADIRRALQFDDQKQNDEDPDLLSMLTSLKLQNHHSSNNHSNRHRQNNAHHHINNSSNHHEHKQQSNHGVKTKTETHRLQNGDTIQNLTCLYYGGPLNKYEYIQKMKHFNRNHVDFNQSLRIGTIIKFPKVPTYWRNLPYAKRLAELCDKNGYNITKNNREDWMMKVVWIVLHEYSCKVVGGFVRDFVYRGETPHDIDIVLPQGMSIMNFQSIMTFRMKQIGVTFIKSNGAQIKGQLFKLSWSKGPLFDADFVPYEAFNAGTYCDVDASNLELVKLKGQNGDVKCRRRVNDGAFYVPDIKKTTAHILLKKCRVISDIWMNNPSAKKTLEQRLRNKYENRGWIIINKQEMMMKGLKW